MNCTYPPWMIPISALFLGLASCALFTKNCANRVKHFLSVAAIQLFTAWFIFEGCAWKNYVWGYEQSTYRYKRRK